MLETKLMREVERSGFASPEKIIHLFIGGSELHGAKVGATDDLDLYGVFVDGPEARSCGPMDRPHLIESRDVAGRHRRALNSAQMGRAGQGRQSRAPHPPGPIGRSSPTIEDVIGRAGRGA